MTMLVDWLERRSAAILCWSFGIVTWLVCQPRLGRPARPMFDETHYLPAARAVIDRIGPINEEHPLLAKQLIALSITLFGDHPLGWRMLSTVAGAATVMLIFAIAMRLYGSTRTAATAALLALFGQLILIQSRLAMLDVYMGAFLLGALALALGLPTSRRPRATLVGTGLCLGAAVACKWAAVPLGAVVGLGAMLWALRRGGVGRAIGAGALIAVPAATLYLASFWPLLRYRGSTVGIADLIPYQLRMLALQVQPLATHRYESDPWSWPLMLRPIWYLYERAGDVTEGVLLIGNPAVMWGGLVAVAAGLVAGVRDRAWAVAAPALLWVASMAQWIVIPKKIGFFYYYYLPALFLPLALAAAFHHWHGGGDRGRLPAVFIAVTMALFVYFYPIISAAPLADPMAFRRWMWLPGWA